jgi:hypothetical protein
MLCNLKEAYLCFNKQNFLKLLGFSKFVDLWPRNCVLVEANGTHSVYTIHQNAKLISGAKLCDLTDKQVKTYVDCPKLFVNVPTVNCHQGDCKLCPIKNIEQGFEDNIIDILT